MADRQEEEDIYLTKRLIQRRVETLTDVRSGMQREGKEVVIHRIYEFLS